MPLWRCPHCSTPQAEAARCWVCHRSTTSCGTCRHFQGSVATGLGLCDLDPRRSPLTGAEMRACWAAPDPLPDEPSERRPAVVTAHVRGSADEIAGRRPRTFVPVDEVVSETLPRGSRTRPADQGAQPAERAGRADRALPPAAPAGWSLWGDLDRQV